MSPVMSHDIGQIMGPTQLTALLPLIAAGALPVVLMLAVAVRRSEALILGLALAGFAATVAALLPAAAVVPINVTPLLRIDGLALFLIGLSALAGAASALLARAEPEQGGRQPEEAYILLALAVLGAGVLGASRHFASLILGLALISVSLFPLIAYARREALAIEAGIKYLVLSGVATGLLLFGAALLYAGIGRLDLTTVGDAVALLQLGPRTESGAWALGGLALVIAALGMKLSLVPLHWWTPDVYQGARASVTGFLASVGKAAVVVALLRLLAETGAQRQPALMGVVATLAVLSMLGGNLLALLQQDVKRLLAYSSIAHMGYLLVALLVAGGLAVEAVCFYLAAYVVTTLGAFGVVTLNGGSGHLRDYRGLFRRRPWLALCMALMLLSLAGIPISAGFVAKFYLFAVGVDAALWGPVAVLLLTSVLGLFYYLRLILVLFAAEDARAIQPPPSLAGAAALAALTAVLLWLGAWPEPLIALIQANVPAGL
jgi:NADH-quinone oxidoreductase subunit N